MRTKEFLAQVPKVIWAIVLGPIAALLIFGESILTIGVLLGALVVAGMWLTVDNLPGIKKLAGTRVGLIGLSVAAAVAVHTVIGTATVTGMIAAATALVFKYILLKMEGSQHEAAAA